MTQRTHGLGALALPYLVDHPGIEVAALVHVSGASGPGRVRRARRALRKVVRIGPLGALNGVRMRRWYGEDLTRALSLKPVRAVAAAVGVRVLTVPSPRGQEARDALANLGVDLGLSLGNGYIPHAVFSIPRLGMLNVHHEVLPAFRGAQGVIWQLHEGSATTGYTIHAIDRSIDTGVILHREEVPICFGETVGDTVTRTMAELYRRSAQALPGVVADAEALLAAGKPQGAGRSFTTPTWRQYLRIRRQHARLRAARAG